MADGLALPDPGFIPDEQYPPAMTRGMLAEYLSELIDRPRWEYRILRPPEEAATWDIAEAWFNEQGDDGWIFCDYRPNESGPGRVLFRRRKG